LGVSAFNKFASVRGATAHHCAPRTAADQRPGLRVALCRCSHNPWVTAGAGARTGAPRYTISSSIKASAARKTLSLRSGGWLYPRKGNQYCSARQSHFNHCRLLASVAPNNDRFVDQGLAMPPDRSRWRRVRREVADCRTAPVSKRYNDEAAYPSGAPPCA
jgi:hypothetical protein